MNSPDFKQQLATFNQQQRADFLNSEIMDLLYQRSDFYDNLLTNLWQRFGFAEQNDVALVAVGGYGRREMFPLSDLDILLLTEQPLDEERLTSFNQLLNLLWDSKFQVSASVRTFEECIEIGRSEISVATNMFESRFLAGNVALWQRLMASLNANDFWATPDFFQAKMQEKAERYARYHNTSYNLEPDLKHSPGGLRDLHLLSWIMLRHYGVYAFETLMQQGILFPEEYHELTQAQSLLFRMRFGLHLQLKRYDNRLRFDRQLQLSEQLGYTGEGNQPVEEMMKHFFQATQSISQLSQLLLNHFEQTVLQDLQPKGKNRPLDRHFYLQDNILFCANNAIFQQYPETILELFYHLTENPTAKISAITLRHLRLALHQRQQPLSDIPAARTAFIRLFSQPHLVKRAIVPMHQLGVLTAYLSQWRQIQGLMQFDMFHIYTVDEHSIRVMLNLEHFLEQTMVEKFPLCSELMPKLPERALIFLAALFHDIAKGREGDHAQMGAEEMRQFASQHGFEPPQADKMAWLVAEHLTMSITAQRRDIHDPDVVKAFAKTVGNATALAALTCLTVADICATNESLWNDWKRTLFRKLYQFTLKQLQLGEEQAINYQKIALAHQNEALEQIKWLLAPSQQRQLQQFWTHCPESYFVRNSPTQLVWHALNYIQTPTLPLVLVSNEYARGATEIFVHCDDQPQLFERIAYTLSAKKISIHDAQIITSDTGFVLDSFIVTEMHGQPLNEERSQQIQKALHKTLATQKTFAFKASKKPAKYQSFKDRTKVRFLANSQPNQTAFELFALDRDGLLAHIGHIFNQLSLNLLNAKITTIGERVEDFFVISNQHNTALNETEKTALKQLIFAELGRM